MADDTKERILSGLFPLMAIGGLGGAPIFRNLLGNKE
jgi:hypothetical protein